MDKGVSIARIIGMENGVHIASIIGIVVEEYAQLVGKFPAFYGTRRFITVFTRDSHISLS
jgi:hypothetical protein